MDATLIRIVCGALALVLVAVLIVRRRKNA